MPWEFVNGIKVIMPYYARVQDYQGLCTKATKELILFRDSWLWDIDYDVCRSAEGYTLRRMNGEDVVIMGPPPPPEEPKEQEIPEEGMQEIEDYVLLVEMGGGLLPNAVCVLSPTEDGRLEPTGYTSEIEADSKDPVGLINQETYRAGWVYESGESLEEAEQPAIRVEQCYRVDQSSYGYVGDPELEEVTLCGTVNGVWNYEDIPFPNHWVSVDPGPPPESLCGYTWDIYAEYGGPGEAEFHDTEHLFYMVASGDRITHWWPPYFNQVIENYQYYNTAGGVCRFPDIYRDDWQYGLGAISSFCFENAVSEMKVTQNRTRRVWGIVYVGGVVTYGESEHPHADVELMDDFVVTEARSGYIRNFEESGCYVFADDSMFIQGLIRGGQSNTDTYRRNVKREYADPENLPYLAWEEGDAVGELLRAFADPTNNLDQLHYEILAGNEAAEEWNASYDPFTYLYYKTEGESHRPPWEVCVNCGGTEYVIDVERRRSDSYVQGTRYTRYEKVSFRDYGIFTKVDTGIDNEGNIVTSDIEPIYAFSLTRGVPDEFDYQILYGMVLDGQLYKSDWFPYNKDTAEATIPGLEDSEYMPNPWVRVGVEYTITPEGINYYINPESADPEVQE